jgi:hypothetical protein
MNKDGHRLGPFFSYKHYASPWLQSVSEKITVHMGLLGLSEWSNRFVHVKTFDLQFGIFNSSHITKHFD